MPDSSPLTPEAVLDARIQYLADRDRQLGLLRAAGVSTGEALVHIGLAATTLRIWGTGTLDHFDRRLRMASLAYLVAHTARVAFRTGKERQLQATETPEERETRKATPPPAYGPRNVPWTVASTLVTAIGLSVHRYPDQAVRRALGLAAVTLGVRELSRRNWDYLRAQRSIVNEFTGKDA